MEWRSNVPVVKCRRSFSRWRCEIASLPPLSTY
jgi:hypothetical protein